MSYNAADIEVLSGLDPVRRRPGMYTDTSRPNHLVHEVVDNSVDEALGGHARTLEVILHADQSIEVIDDGRGMPVDLHPVEKLPGVELILSRLHAGGKFSGKNYEFSGGLHGVGVSVVNALSKRLECRVKRGGEEFLITFRDGHLDEKLRVVGKAPRGVSGTSVRFWPDGSYFDSDKVSVSRLRHVLRAKAVLCPGLRVKLFNEPLNEREEWFYAGGRGGYLADQLGQRAFLPEEPFSGSMKGGSEVDDWAVAWVPDGKPGIGESYVNLIPTAEGGTHVNGLRAG
ncbi:MAG: ATP-binding protein, partial [Gammaproteobacteria bacterium]